MNYLSAQPYMNLLIWFSQPDMFSADFWTSTHIVHTAFRVYAYTIIKPIVCNKHFHCFIDVTGFCLCERSCSQLFEITVTTHFLDLHHFVDKGFQIHSRYSWGEMGIYELSPWTTFFSNHFIPEKKWNSSKWAKFQNTGRMHFYCLSVSTITEKFFPAWSTWQNLFS